MSAAYGTDNLCHPGGVGHVREVNSFAAQETEIRLLGRPKEEDGARRGPAEGDTEWTSDCKSPWDR